MRIKTFLVQATVIIPIAFLASILTADEGRAQDVDLVVNITGDQPAYMAQDMQSFSVTISNNGPDTATNVELVVEHPIAETPFEDSATCQALSGANPNGPAVCPPGSGTAPSAAFVRNGQTFSVTLPEIPALSQARIDFQTQVHCPSSNAGEPACFGVPTGNFIVSADVTAAEADSNDVTNTSTTNVFLFPPDVQYAVDIVDAPTTATPGSVVEYEFELYSFGLQPSDLLNLNIEIRGEAGTMSPLSVTNHPYGASGSTLPNTELLSIDCLSASLGSYPLASVFPSTPAPWQTCPSTGLIPIPTPSSPQNNAPVTGFPTGDFLADLPGTLDGPPGGGVMRFRAEVLVGDPVCVDAPEIGVRDLVFEFSVQGLQGTDLVPPGPADNTATVIAEVPGNCEVADVEFTTESVPASPALDGNGDASWLHEVTVANLSTGPSAGTATDVDFEFEHHSLAFAHSYGALSCSSSPGGLCPSPTELNDGIVSTSNSHFRFASMIDSLPPGGSVTVSLPVDISRTTCWGSNTAEINLIGQASPSPALHDPIYSTVTPPEPPPFTPGSNPFFGNNGLQATVPVTGLDVCPGGSPQSFIEVEKTGPFASAADAAAGTPLIGQTPANFIADGTEVFYKIVVTNPNTVNAVPLGELNDFNFNLPGLATSPPSGFVHSGNDLSDWGITCTPAPASEDCHDLASSFISTGYTNSFTLSYDPTLHGGNSEVPLAPEATLTYIVPFTMPVHLNRCHDPELTSNNVAARYVNAAGNLVSTPQSIVDHYIGMPPCTPGALEIEKTILPPATDTSIPVSGEISWSVTLTNASASETLDIPRFVDETFAFGVNASIVNVDCNVLSGGAQCPPTPVIPGVQTPASGPTSPLSDPLHIDHEWGAIGDDTFPPGGSIEFVITAQLANPTSMFGCIFNRAKFNAPNDPNGWIPAEDSATSCPPPAPELSVQKTVSPQIAAPGDTVSYTVTVVNIGSASADGTVLVDPLPPALLPANPGGYVNVSCSDISGSGFIPNPQGTAVCPPITSDPTGLQATIATFGPNTALEFTYQAVMPASVVSVDNQATVSAPSPGGLSFGAGTAQSQQNVQVQSGTTGEPPIGPPGSAAPVPSLTQWAAALLALMMLIVAGRTGLLRARA
ncbi:MAG: hypothetical protein U5L08_05050 [Xanthomonadales bacterium]|nr:hypothetical protein [Xanthomonadales bacterium]